MSRRRDRALMNTVSSRIDIEGVLRALPHFDTFCSVEALHKLVDSLRSEPDFTVNIAGTSAQGLPIHHVRFGTGSTKALFVAFPHCDEPIGGLTVFSLLTLLKRGHPQLLDADVEWHIVPCIDPDGAGLNEGWTQQRFTLESYMRNFHKQELREQVECSFPIRHKKLVFDQPTREARVLQRLLARIRPDFYYSLHNAWAGGAFFFLSRDIGARHYRALYDLLDQHRIPLQADAPHGAWCPRIAEGIYELGTMKDLYDFLEPTTPAPEDVLQTGACSWEYLSDIKEEAMAFVTELPYVRHPSAGSAKKSTQNLRQLKLRVDADNKYLATVILEEWDRVEADLDRTSPFYRKVFGGVVCAREKLFEGLPAWPQKTRDTLFNPAYRGTMTEGERFNVYLFDRFYVLCHSHEFLRLLRASVQTPGIRASIERVECVFDEALAELAQHVDFDEFEIVDCNALARVQLGSGLVVLNALLERHSTRASR